MPSLGLFTAAGELTEKQKMGIYRNLLVEKQLQFFDCVGDD